MIKRKKITSIALTIIMIITLCLSFTGKESFDKARAAADYSFRSFGTNLQWRLSMDGYLEITLVDSSQSSEWPSNWGSGNINAPWYPFRDGIKIVAIGEGINKIGDYAFNACTSLAIVNQFNGPGKAGITHIGNYAFNGCVSLTDLEIWGDTSVIYIGDYAFNNCVSLSHINTEDTFHIGNYAFNGCLNIASLKLPAVANIGNYAFNGCVNLNRIDLPGRMESIGEGVFSGCRSLETINVSDLGDGYLYLDVIREDPSEFGVLFCVYYNLSSGEWEARIIKAEVWDTGVLRSYNILERPEIDFSRYPPNYVQEKVNFPLKRIDVEAFAYQSNFTKVTVPATVDYIGLNAFSWSNNLKEAHFFGHAPIIPQVPNVNNNARIFESVDREFVIYFDFYPNVSSTGWPLPPSTNWRGYKAIANNVYVLIAPSTPDNPYTPVVTTLSKGSTIQLRATVYPQNASQEVIWSSKDPDIATVSSTGVVHGISEGETIITVTTADGSRFASRRVHVIDRIIPITAVALNKSRMTLILETEGGVDSGLPFDTLTAIVHPNNTAPAPTLIWKSSNTSIAYVDIIDPLEPHNAIIVGVSPGTATITVTAKTEFGEITSTETTVIVTANPYDPSVFVPVTSIALDPAVPSLPMGGTINLSELATVLPQNATNKEITGWRILEDLSTISGAVITMTGELSVPAIEMGMVVVEATILKGRSDAQWGYGADIADADYTQFFTISVVSFEPVIAIQNIPQTAHAGVPLLLTGTVVPQDRPIHWSISEDDSGETAAYIDPVSGMLVAQRTGFLRMVATVYNGKWVDSLTGGTLETYRTIFTIRVLPYDPKVLTIRANPGGRISIANSQSPTASIVVDKSVEETLEIRAHPDPGYIFAGWSSTNGGEIKDASNPTTMFTMPMTATTVTAFFTYTGVSSGSSSGAVVIPTPSHYFTYGNRYQQGSDVDFSHITRRDFQLFSHVSLDERTLVKDGHYTVERIGAYTMVTLVNGYLDSLGSGSYTLNVYFSDLVTISATFTIEASSSTAIPQSPIGAQMFDDVRVGDWFYMEVSYVAERGWVTSNASDPRLFRPNSSATQGEAIDALYRLSGRPGMISSDGRGLSGRSAALEWARQNGIVPVGGVINADSLITRQDMAQLLSRLVSANNMKYPITRAQPNFVDEWSIDQAVRSAVINLYRAGIIDGRTVNTFVPQGNLSRAELSVILYRFTNVME
ncbi:MAG: leucine-rich repeat protein [Oscillospiraceae bacterium]|nr:leucine-rich repeat protein [Oscillospiraceae bacterium]